MPAGLVADEDVRLGSDTGIYIKATQWNGDDFQLGIESWHQGTAGPAENLSEVLCPLNLVCLQVFLALEEPDTVELGKSVADIVCNDS